MYYEILSNTMLRTHCLVPVSLMTRYRQLPSEYRPALPIFFILSTDNLCMLPDDMLDPTFDPTF